MKFADKAVRFSPLNQPLGACNHVMLLYQIHWNDPICLSAFEAVYPYSLTHLAYINAFNDVLLVEYRCENRRNLNFNSEYAELIIAYSF